MKKNVISAHPGIYPGPLIQKSDTLTMRPRCQVVRVSKNIHIGQIFFSYVDGVLRP